MVSTGWCCARALGSARKEQCLLAWAAVLPAHCTTHALRCLLNHTPPHPPRTLAAPLDNYAAELTEIADQLLAYTKAAGAKLVFTTTTPFICTTQQDGCVQTLNNWAKDIMSARGIPVIDSYTPVIERCGKAPQASCFGAAQCWCPHCGDAGYAWLAGNVIAPALRALLQ